jgi:hypothetical protein
MFACRNTSFDRLKEEFKEQNQGVVNQNSHIIDTSKVISFKDDILFIMEQQCGANDNSCHSAQAVAAGTSNISLFDYAGVKAAQDPDGLLYSSVIWDGNASKMPSKSKTQIDKIYIGAIKKWIDNGMSNN